MMMAVLKLVENDVAHGNMNGWCVDPGVDRRDNKGKGEGKGKGKGKGCGGAYICEHFI